MESLSMSSCANFTAGGVAEEKKVGHSWASIILHFLALHYTSTASLLGN